MVDRLIHGVLSSRLLIVVLAVLVMAAGWASYRQLPVDAFPDVSPNLVQVFTVTEGLAPEEIEKYVTFPVEVAMNGLPGVEEIRSVSNFGLSVVNVYFEDDMDIYFARQVVGERLQEAREQIPEGFGDPQMGPISTGMGLILFYYLEDTTGRYTLEELRTIQDWLVKFQLQTVPGVTEVLGIGGWEKQFHVEVDPNALLRYDVSLGEVIEAIRANNLNVGAQFLERNCRGAHRAFGGSRHRHSRPRAGGHQDASTAHRCFSATSPRCGSVAPSVVASRPATAPRRWSRAW